MRRARLSKNDNGTYDLTFYGITPVEARQLMRMVAVGEGLPESFTELFNQLFDGQSGMPITHLKNPVMIGNIQ